MDVGELLSFKVSIFLFYIFLSWIENACYYYLVPKVLEQRPAKIPTLHIPALSYIVYDTSFTREFSPSSNCLLGLPRVLHLLLFLYIFLTLFSLSLHLNGQMKMIVVTLMMTTSELPKCGEWPSRSPIHTCSNWVQDFQKNQQSLTKNEKIFYDLLRMKLPR